MPYHLFVVSGKTTYTKFKMKIKVKTDSELLNVGDISMLMLASAL